jgi:hypothetical protein
MVHMYSVFGGRFRSDLTFGDLTPASGTVADWSLEAIEAPCPARGGMLDLGRDQVTGDVAVRLYRHDDGMRLVFDDTGTFDVVEGGRRILWFRTDAADLEAVRLDVLGRVLPLALHMRSTFTLHGSSVRLGDGAVAFLAPKHRGKSTLAWALTAAGGELLSDDAVPVQMGHTATTLPGIRGVRLWSDSASRVGAAAPMVPGHRDHKCLFETTDPAPAPMAPVPLAGIYLLMPVSSTGGSAAACRARLTEIEGTIALISQMKLGPLLGGGEGGRTLAFCAQLSSRIPVHRLKVVRDFDRLDDVVSQLIAWHATAPDRGGRAPAWAP